MPEVIGPWAVTVKGSCDSGRGPRPPGHSRRLPNAAPFLRGNTHPFGSGTARTEAAPY